MLEESNKSQKKTGEKKKSQIQKKDVIIGATIIGLALFGTFGVLGIMKVALRTDMPMVVVISGSMEPTIYRGDLLFVEGVDPEDIKVGTIEDKQGDIIIYDSHGVWDRPTEEPIVHRVVGKKVENETIYFLTKGDNNPDTDPPGPGEKWVPADKVIGRVVSIIPKIGYVRIYLAQGNLGYYIIGLLAIILVVSIVKDILYPEDDKDKKDSKKDGSGKLAKQKDKNDESGELDSQKYDMGL